MLKRKPSNEYYQMLPYYTGEFEDKRNNIDSESAKEASRTVEKPMIDKRRFERENGMITCKFYMKNEDIPENKEIFVYGFRHIKADKVDNFILFGCELDEIYEFHKLFHLWSKTFLNKEIKKRNFKITR